jgi:hypothetical protein
MKAVNSFKKIKNERTKICLEKRVFIRDYCERNLHNCLLWDYQIF